MNSDDATADAILDQNDPPGVDAHKHHDLELLRRDYEARLLQANLRTEAVRAGMIDLDGLKLIDPTAVKTDEGGNIIDGKGLMTSLQKRKPWLFGSMSSSSLTPPPSSAPLKQRMAADMTDEEYAAARAALTKHSY